MAEDSPGSKFKLFALGLLFAAGYVYITAGIERYESVQLISIYSILFGLFGWCWLARDDLSLKQWCQLAVFVRLSFLLVAPNLSDDFYRFIWDGRLLAAGLDPFAEIPSFYLQAENAVAGMDQSLFNLLNSPEYFTVYPPVNQFVFWIAALVGGESMVVSLFVIRLFILIAALGNIWLIPKLLIRYDLNPKLALLYLLNPLVVLETVGNLHFEGMMVFFILLTLWFLERNKQVLSSFALALAIGVKLIPLIFLPFLPRPLNLKKMVIYYGVCAFALALIFFPLVSPELISGMQNSLGLYFQKFEFNGSVYLILREQGFQEYGYNRIAHIGKDLMEWTFWAIMILAFWPLGKKPNLPTQFLFALGVYFLLSTTVHPWYIITLVGLSIFTNYRSPILWSFMIFLTYIGYSEDGFDMPTWVLFIEYGFVLVFFIYELLRELGFMRLIKSKLNA